ncbi:MAG: EamA family transporter [Gammaproteobacteria bacterium]|nr:MAG: EamA family transporter [Gammaproteobacteria bacterium]
MTHQKPNLIFTQIPIGIRYMILSAFGFAIMAVCVKWTSKGGIPVLEIVAARSLISLVLSILDVKRKRLPLFGHRKPLLIARGTVGAFALMCVYYAITALPLAEATVLQYLHPVFTALLALFLLKERLHPPTIVCIVLSFIGVLIIARPAFLFGDDIQKFSMISIGIGILGAFGSAIAYVLVRKLNETEDPSVIIFYFPLIALPISLFFLGNEFVMPTGRQWIELLCVGIFTQIGQIGLTKSMQTETASRATAFSYLQVVFSVFLGWFVFDEIPVIFTWIGGGFILLGALINLFWKRKLN